MDKRKRLRHLLSQESIMPKKYNYGRKTVVVLPSPVQKKDMNDYQYSKDIDEKVVKMAAQLAERMAVSMIRESLSMNVDNIVERVVESLSEKIVEAIPEQQTTIQQVVSEEAAELKKEAGELVFEKPELSVDRSKGLKLHGKVGEKTKSEGSTDEALDLLDDLF